VALKTANNFNNTIASKMKFVTLTKVEKTLQYINLFRYKIL